jgi:molybdopterin-containing oxidoreductase family membrane subunit
MNVGAWALLVFSACAFLAALDTFLEHRGGRSIPYLRLVVGIIGGLFGFFIAAYPGVLLGATARPLFVNAQWLGALFLAVGASTGAAAMVLILGLTGGQSREALARLMRVTSFALILQAAFLILFIGTVKVSASVGVGRALSVLLSGPYSLTFWLGAVVIGIVVPLGLQLGGVIKKTAPAVAVLASALVLVGGFLTKYVLIAAGQVGGT